MKTDLFQDPTRLLLEESQSRMCRALGNLPCVTCSFFLAQQCLTELSGHQCAPWLHSMTCRGRFESIFPSTLISFFLLFFYSLIYSLNNCLPPMGCKTEKKNLLQHPSFERCLKPSCGIPQKQHPLHSLPWHHQGGIHVAPRLRGEKAPSLRACVVGTRAQYWVCEGSVQCSPGEAHEAIHHHANLTNWRQKRASDRVGHQEMKGTLQAVGSHWRKASVRAVPNLLGAACGEYSLRVYNQDSPPGLVETNPVVVAGWVHSVVLFPGGHQFIFSTAKA